jgi:hypothetical protein
MRVGINVLFVPNQQKPIRKTTIIDGFVTGCADPAMPPNNKSPVFQLNRKDIRNKSMGSTTITVKCTKYGE